MRRRKKRKRFGFCNDLKNMGREAILLYYS